MKLENILLTENATIKFCDFGSSKVIKNPVDKCGTQSKIVKSSPFVTSRYYRGPELILGKTDYDY